MTGPLPRPLAQDRQLQQACDELDRRLAAGEARAAEAVMTAYPQLAADPDSALQLIYDELVRRERRGEQPAYEEYYQRFPHWQDELRKSFDIHEALVRRAAQADAPRNPGGGHRYELLGEIGRGGMGVVYQARQPGLNRIVALKMILAGEYASAEDQARFRREAETAARLQHPNIVQVYEVGEQDGLPFLAMEYVEGGSLAERLKGTLLTAPEAARLVETLARAVQYAHEHGVLHRDLKPGNILLVSGGVVSGEWSSAPLTTHHSPLTTHQPKIADFGLAKRLFGGPEASVAAGQTQTGAILGTPSYMAPEQASGSLDGKRPSGIGPATDVWALGAILYESLTGRPPFHGDTVLETLFLVKENEPLSLRQLQPKVPRDLETICLKCLHKEPAQRYASAFDLAEDLRRFRDGESIHARPAGALERTWRWCRRKPVLAGLLATLALLVGVVTVGGPVAAFLIDRQRREAREELRKSSLQQARAERRTGQMGQRHAGLEALGRAAAIRPSIDLRTEAIACLALTDLRLVRQWAGNTRVHNAVAFDANLERYARMEDADISVRRVDDDQETLRLHGPGKCPWWAVTLFSGDGRLLASKHVIPGRGGQCCIWDLSRGQTILQVPCIGPAPAWAFSPDSRQLAVGQPGGAVAVYEVESGREVLRVGQIPLPDQIAFHPTEPRLAISRADNNAVEVRSLQTGAVVATVPPNPGGAHALTWVDEGRLLAVSTDPGAVHVWDTAAGQQRAVLLGHTARPTVLLASPAGNLLVSTGWDDTTRVWDPFSGRQLVEARGIALAFNADGSRLTFCQGEQLGVWEVTPGACRTLIHGPGDPRQRTGTYRGPWGLSYSPDGRWLGSAADDGIRLWDAATGRERAHLPAGATDSVLFHPAGTHLLSHGDDLLQCWPLRTDAGAPDHGLPVGPPRSLGGPANPVLHARVCRWGPGGNSLAAIANLGETLAIVMPFNAPGEAVELKGRRLTSLAYSPDGRWLAAGAHVTEDVLVWDLTTGTVVKELPGSRPDANAAEVAFSPDGRWLVVGGQGEYRFWRVGTWEAGLAIPRERLEVRQGRMAFTGDGKVLAITWSRLLVRLVDTADGRELATLTSHDFQPISQLCFSPDEHQLAVAAENYLIHLWDLRQLRAELAKLGLDWDPPR